jgi:hypothetical protein
VPASGVCAALPIPKDSRYTHVFWMLAGASVFATLAARLIPTAGRRSTPDVTSTPAPLTDERTDETPAPT